MKVWRPEPSQPSPEDLQQLDRLRSVINAAVADGKISGAEMVAIRAQASSDGKVTVAELELYRKLVTEKLATGELEYEWN